MYQRTLAKKVSITGIGLHTGKKITMVLHPAPACSGIRFKRIDLDHAEVLHASATTVGVTENNTTLGNGLNVVHTVEHLIATFYGLGINNVYCELDGPEIPIMDGSSASFLFILKETGTEVLPVSRSILTVTRPIRVEFEDKWATIEPHSHLVIDSTVVFPHPVIKKQEMIFEFSAENFVSEIGRARTFGMLKDVDRLKQKGLALGGSLDNAIVLDDFKVVNPEGLRFSDEFVRHKILDTIGDVALLGHDLAAKITTYKSGHKVHNLLCRKLLESPDAYKIISASEKMAHSSFVPGTLRGLASRH